MIRHGDTNLGEEPIKGKFVIAIRMILLYDPLINPKYMPF
jgi:hypothetical protein